MKRAVAIFLTIVHLVNIIGVYAICARLERVYDQNVSEKLNGDEFAGSDAITLRMPFALPYSSQQENYERVEGKFEYSGEVYQLVKKKLYMDTLYIVCVKDRKATEIKATFKDLALAMTNPQNDHKQGSKIVNLLVKDFESASVIQVKPSLFLIDQINFSEYAFSRKINTDFSLDQPPKA